METTKRAALSEGRSEEVVNTFLETCLLSKQSNDTLVSMFRKNCTISENAIKVVGGVLSSQHSFETRLKNFEGLFTAQSVVISDIINQKTTRLCKF